MISDMAVVTGDGKTVVRQSYLGEGYIPSFWTFGLCPMHIYHAQWRVLGVVLIT